VAGRTGAEVSAEELVAALDAVSSEPGEACPDDDLEVRWRPPADDPDRGAWVQPLGPAPDQDTERVNGLVVCKGSDHQVAGFQAAWDGDRWSVALVPELGDDEQGDDRLQASPPTSQASGASGADTDSGQPDDDAPEEPSEEPADEPLEPGAEPVLPGQDPDVLADDSPWVGLWDEEIEPLAAYEPQQVCSPSAKPGALGFRNLVLRAYPETGDSGISRDCGQGGRSEHKEGRAWDWTANVHDGEERQAAAEVIGWLLATDEHGNDYAMARRLGVMYVIYNGNIWSAYAAEDGWRPYVGRSDHTDHVHISFNVQGGLGKTSFWDVPDLEELANSRFGPAAILPEYGGGIGFTPTLSEESVAAPVEGTGGSLTPPPSSPPSSGSQASGGGGGGGGSAGTDPPPAPVAPPPPLPPLPPVTIPTPLEPVLDPLLCGLLPCPPED
jgi:hypothetical protein